MSSTLSKPDTTALSAHRRAADQNAILCAAQQKRFGAPPRRARNGRLHHRHTGRVIMRNRSAATEGCEAPRALLTSAGDPWDTDLTIRRRPSAGGLAVTPITRSPALRYRPR